MNKIRLEVVCKNIILYKFSNIFNILAFPSSGERTLRSKSRGGSYGSNDFFPPSELHIVSANSEDNKNSRKKMSKRDPP